MAQHSLTYKDIREKNVRNIYSGLPSPFRFRSQGHAEIQLPRRIKEFQKNPPDRFQSKFLEFDPHYKVAVSRAPAFRIMDEEKVEEIVNRVTRPTNTHRRPLETCHREKRRHHKDACTTCVMASLKKRVSQDEMDLITSRLMRPTTCTTMRIMMRTPNADAIYKVRPCTAYERLEFPEGRENCCVPCRILRQTNRPRLSTLV